MVMQTAPRALKRFASIVAFVMLGGLSNVDAASFNVPVLGENINVNTNLTVIVVAAIRSEPRADSAIGKNNLNPEVHGRTN